MIFRKPSVKQFCEANREEVLKWYAQTQPQGEYINMEKAFVDLKGRQYYRFISAQKNIPLERIGAMQDYQISMASGLDKEETMLLLNAIRHEHAKAFVGKQVDTIKIGALLNEFEDRWKMIVHAELIYHYLAVQFVRDDEPKGYVVDSIHMDKVNSIKELVKSNGDYSFFQCPELMKVNEYMRSSELEWEPCMTASIREINRLKKKVQLLKEWKESERLQKTGVAR